MKTLLILLFIISGQFFNESYLTVFNIAADFVTGYEQSDITGDNIVDLADIVLVFNNSRNFVHAFVP